MNTWSSSLEHFLWHPRWIRQHPGIRYFIQFARYPYALIRDAGQGDLNMRAMSLVYTTMLSLVPLIALSFSILKAFNFHHEIEPFLNHVLAPLGDQANILTTRILSFVDNARGAALGSIGLAILLFTVFSMVHKVEESLNFVWQVNRARNLARRFTDYLSLVLVGPMIMIIILSLFGALSFDAVTAKLQQYDWIAQSTVRVRGLLPLAIVALTFAFIYAYLPNTKVQPKAALVGGFWAGLTWMVAGGVFSAAVARSTSTTAIYSTFAIMFIALIWLYIGWLIVLLGARIAFYFQNPQFLRYGAKPIDTGNTTREMLALAMMHTVAISIQKQGQRLELNQIAQSLKTTTHVLQPLAERLERSGILLRCEDNTLVPAIDIDQITLFDVIASARSDHSTQQFQHAPNYYVDKQIEALIMQMNALLKEQFETTSLGQLASAKQTRQEPQKSDNKHYD